MVVLTVSLYYVWEHKSEDKIEKQEEKSGRQ